MSKVQIYIATSLDGYIAGEGDDLKFLEKVQVEGEDYGYGKFISEVGTVIIGSNTYKKIETFSDWPYQAPVIVLTSTPEKFSARPNVRFYNGHLKDLIEEIKKSSTKNIFIDGGAKAIEGFLELDLVDEMTINIVPTLLGKGVRLFEKLNSSINLNLLKTQYFDSGLVQIHYSIVR